MSRPLSEFQQFFEQFCYDFVYALGAEPTVEKLDASILKSGRFATTFLLSAADLKGVLKAFDDTPDGHAAFRRERDVQLLLKGKNLAPPFLQFSDTGRFVLSRYVEGNTARELPKGLSLEDFARKAGLWIATFESAMPKEVASTDWAAYLENYPDLQESEVFQDLSGILGQFGISTMVLARNDNALENFLIDVQGNVLGVDFDNSMMKPAGWDLCMAAYALVDLKTENVDRVLPELVAGYRSHPETLVPADVDLGTLIRTMIPLALDSSRAG